MSSVYLASNVGFVSVNSISPTATPVIPQSFTQTMTITNQSKVTSQLTSDGLYRVYTVGGDTVNDAATNVTITIYSVTPITIYYVCVGAGGSSPAIPNISSNVDGGPGAGAFFQGSYNLTESYVEKKILLRVLQKNIGTIYSYSNPNTVLTFPNTTILAGVGGGGSGDGAGINGSSSRGGPASFSSFVSTSVSPASPSPPGYSGGAGANGSYSGGGGGAGGVGGLFVSVNEHRIRGGDGATVLPSIRGIYNIYRNQIFCAGGQGASLASYSGGNWFTGASGVGIFGCGGGANGSYTPNVNPGQPGCIIFAISVADFPGLPTYI
jgi:hypothetical protein